MYNNSPRGRPSLSFIFSFSRSGGWLVHPPHGRAKCLPRRGWRGMRNIRGASLGPSQPCPTPRHAIPQAAARSACSLDTPSPAPPAGLELAGMRRRHQTTSALCRSCCPRPLRLILKHIPMCCAVVSCFPPSSPPHFTALFECALVLRQVYNEGGPEQAVVTLLLLSPPPQPRSGFIRTPSTLLGEQSPTELITGEPIFFQPFHNGASPMLIPTCQNGPARLHPRGMQVGFSGGKGDTWEMGDEHGTWMQHG